MSDEPGGEHACVNGVHRVRIALAFWLLLAVCPSASALNPSSDISQYAHTAWRIRDGFTDGAIFSIAQTPDGYLWLGTVFGLLRFDGVLAVPWQPPKGEQLPSSFIQKLVVGRDGTLWIGTLKGLASWKDGHLTRYPEGAGQRVSSMLEDAEGTMWFGVVDPGRLCAVQAAGTHQCYGDGGFGWSADPLYQDHTGNLWVSAETGLWRWAPGAPVRYVLSESPVKATAMVEGDNGALLMATGLSTPFAIQADSAIEGLKQLESGRLRDYPLAGRAGQFKPTTLFRSRDGSVWIGTPQGLLHVHQGRTDRFAMANGLSGDVVTGIIEDREGDIWVSTQDGLDRFREVVAPRVSVDEGLSRSLVAGVQSTPDGSVWISTANGLNRWQNGRITLYDKRPANGGLPKVDSLGLDDRGRLWAGSRDGVFMFEGGRFRRVPGVPGGNMFSLAGDGQGTVWISNNDQGLFEAAPEGTVQSIPWTRIGHKNGASAVFADRAQGGVWLGFFEGGVTYLKDGQVRASYNVADGLGGGEVNDFQAGADGAVWIATQGGLSLLKDGHITTLSSTRGLPCDAVHWALEDDAHSVWLYMSCGLVRIARSELEGWMRDSKRAVQTTFFGVSDGMRIRSVAGRYGPKVTRSSDGTMWFLTPDGVGVLDPRHIPFNTIPPPVHIEQIAADRTTYEASSPLRLPSLVRDLEIDYNALSLVAPEKNRFKVKLEGRDRDWEDVGNRRQAFYNDLPPGSYRFRVMAANNSGVWNEAGAALDFSIAPAYYQTAWFRVLAVVSFLSLLWAAHRLRLRVVEGHEAQIRAVNERMIKAQEHERMHIAGELHDGVMQQISALTLMLGTAKRQPEPAAKETIADVQRKLIEVGADVRQLSHGLHPAQLKEGGLPEALRAYCDEFSHVRGIAVSCEADDRVRDLSRGAALAVYRIAQEALGNAGKHAAPAAIEVRLTRSNDTVSLTISDNGVGCDPSSVGVSGGLGLVSMRERARQLNGTFAFDSTPGRGTTVTVTIPFR
jgi:signal transduction histidine kinase/ligand-binding sensor domain-containing protein